MNTFTGFASAIHCEGCAASIKRSLGKLPGIQNVDVDIEGKSVRAEYEPNQVNAADILARLEAAGFPAETRDGK